LEKDYTEFPHQGEGNPKVVDADKGAGDRVIYSPDGRRLATSSGDTTIKLWDAKTWQELPPLTLKGHARTVMKVAFSPDGKSLLSLTAGATKPVSGPVEGKVWDVQTGREVLTFGADRPHLGVMSAAFSPDGTRVAAVVGQRKIPQVKVWDAQTGKEVFSLQGHSATVNCLAFSPDSQRLASGSEDLTLRIWNLQKGQQMRTLEEVKVWDTHTRKETRSLKARAEGTGILRGVAFSPDGKRLASVSSGGPIPPIAKPPHLAKPPPVVVKVWDVASGKELFSSQGQGRMPWDSPTRLAFSADGRRLACAYLGEGKVWDVQTRQELVTFKGGDQNVIFSPDGKRLAGAVGGGVKVWDAETGKEVRTFPGHTNSVAFSPDGKRLASTSDDGTVKVWDAQTGDDPLLSFKGHANHVYSVAFSPDGKRLATASTAVKLWDAQTGQLLLTLKGHADSVVRVAFSPDGHRLASVDESGTVKFWDATPLPEKK
jgi:WD40 repeat protein